MMPVPQPNDSRRLRLLFYLYLALITSAEITTAFYIQAGMIAHLSLLAVLLIHAACGVDKHQRNLALALALAPLIRVVSLTLPLAHFPQMVWYPILAAPLLLATALIARHTQLAWKDLGLHRLNLPLQLALATGGLGIGALEYLILRPTPSHMDRSWPGVLLSGFVLLLFTGFMEEVVFRGLLQQLAQAVLGRRVGLWYIAILFGVLHIGYLSILDVVFVAMVGALFGQLVGWSRSILGVALAHGVANMTLFLLMPYVMQQAPHELALGIESLIFVGALAFIIVAGTLSWQSALEIAKARRSGRPAYSRAAIGLAPLAIDEATTILTTP
jgi:uncharacterized protein